MMDQLVWCGRIRNGISLTAPNETLASAYLKKAEEALETMQTIPRSRLEDNDRILRDILLPLCCPHGSGWCENHACTILLMERLLSDYFAPAEAALVEKARGARVDAQYYVSREIPDLFCEELIRAAPRFLVKCTGIVDGMSEKAIGALRGRLTEALREEG